MRLPLCDLRRAIDEQRALRGLRIDNVYQCGPRTFLLKLVPGKLFLVLDVEPERARVLVTETPPPVPDAPPVFGGILRRALRGAKVLGAMLLGEDRVIALDVDAGEAHRRVVVEAFARHGTPPRFRRRRETSPLPVVMSGSSPTAPRTRASRWGFLRETER